MTYLRTGGMLSTLDSLESLRCDTREYSEETSRMLDNFTAEIDSAAADLIVTLGDFAADLDEIL